MTKYVGHDPCTVGFVCDDCNMETPCDRMYVDCWGDSICELCAESHDSSCEDCGELESSHDV